MIAVSYGDHIDVVSPDDGVVRASLRYEDESNVYGVRFSSDNSLVIAEVDDVKTLVWSSNDGSLMKVFDGTVDVDLSPSTATAAVMTGDGLSIVDLVTDRVIATVPMDNGGTVRYSRDGTTIACANGGQLSVYDSNDLTPITTTFVPNDIREFSYTSTGDYIIVNAELNSENVRYVLRSDLTVKDFKSVPMDSQHYDFVLPTGDAFFASGSRGQRTVVVDASTGTDFGVSIPRGAIVYGMQGDDVIAISGQHVVLVNAITGRVTDVPSTDDAQEVAVSFAQGDYLLK